MASNKIAHKLFYLANCMPVIRREVAAVSVKGADAATGGKAAEYLLRGSGHSCSKPRTMASAAQELEPEEARHHHHHHHERGHHRHGALFRGKRYSPWGAFDLLDSFFPNRNLRSMIDRMDRIFDDPFFARSRGGWPGGRTAGEVVTRPPWDFVETDEAFRMRLDLPGLSKEEVKVFVEDGNLVIKGEYNEENKADEAQWTNSRSLQSQYSTRILLPDNVNAESIKAELKNGVLSVTVPKVVEEEPKKNVIDVQIE